MPEPFDHLGLLRDAVGTASFSGEEAAVARVLHGHLARFCHQADIDAAGNVVGVWGSGPLKVCFLGHIDTAPGWLEVREAGGWLHGRGAVDAKGSFCAAVAAVARLAEAEGHESLAEKLTVQLIGAVEEEAPSSSGAHYAVAHYPRPDYLIVCEPSGAGAVTLGYKGSLNVSLSAARAVSHSADLSTTAPELLVCAYRRIEAAVGELNAGLDQEFERVQLSLLGFSSSDDGLSQAAEMRLRLRLPPRLAPGEMATELGRLLVPLGVGCVSGAGLAAHRADAGSRLAGAFRAAIRSQGLKPVHKVKSGTSDMNVVAPSWDVPMLAYGPGDSKLDHTPEERLELAEYETAVTVIGGALKLLADGLQS